MIFDYVREANALAEEGVTPARIDAVMKRFGFPMGPFAMSDLSGLDIGLAVQKARGDGGIGRTNVLERLVEHGSARTENDGRLFQVRQIGRQRARADPRSRGRASSSPKRRAKPASRRARSATTRSASAFSARWSIAAQKLLDEGVALRPGDIDIVYVYGYGFPPHHGGPMWYAGIASCRRSPFDELSDDTVGGRAGFDACVRRSIVSAARTPIGRAFRGAFNQTPGATMAGHVVKHAIERASLDPGRSRRRHHGLRSARRRDRQQRRAHAALRAGCPVTVPGETVSRFCASGLDAIAIAAKRVIADGAKVIVARRRRVDQHGAERLNLHFFTEEWLLRHAPDLYMPMLYTADFVAKKYSRFARATRRIRAAEPAANGGGASGGAFRRRDRRRCRRGSTNRIERTAR